MSAMIRVTAAALVLLLPLSASANWFRGHSTTTTAYYWYPAGTVYYVPTYQWVYPAAPVYGTPDCQPAPVAAAIPVYAVPQAAPPQGIPVPAAPSTPTAPTTPTVPQQPVPPPGQPMNPALPKAGVGERSSFYDAYPAVQSNLNAVAAERSSVSFWNNTNRDLVLKVDGVARSVRQGQSINLTLPRSFVWQIDDRQPATERLPANQSALDIVIRR